ncbi:unnamed protein product [Arctogadus glacialis]
MKSSSGPHRTGLLRPGPDFRDLVRTSETWSGLQRPGPGFRDLVRASETWSGLQRPGPGFRDRLDRSVGGGGSGQCDAECRPTALCSGRTTGQEAQEAVCGPAVALMMSGGRPIWVFFAN